MTDRKPPTYYPPQPGIPQVGPWITVLVAGTPVVVMGFLALMAWIFFPHITHLK